MNFGFGTAATPTLGQPRNMRVGNNPYSTTLGSIPATVNQTPGMLANDSVSSLFQIQGFVNKYEEELREGQLVFVFKKNEQTNGKRSLDAMMNKTIMMNLPMLNYKLFQSCLIEDKNSQDWKDWHTAKLLSMFSVMGVIKTNAANRVSRIPHREHELVLNVCTRGQYRTFNVWGDCSDGELLYLRLERARAGGVRKRGSGYDPNTVSYEALSGPNYSMKCDGLDCTSTEPIEGPWQLVPIKHTTRADAIRDQYTYDIYVGRVFRPRRCVKSGGPQLERTRKLHRMVAGDQLEIFVDV